MGLLKLIQSIKYARMLKKAARSDGVKAWRAQSERYAAMSSDELRAMSDGELFTAIMHRTELIADRYENFKDALGAMTDKQKVFYSVNWFECEVNNGGLCQFFVNSSRTVAPFISEYLGIIGASEHKALYDGFIAAHAIDVTELSCFDSATKEDFVGKYSLYPFEEFDDTYYSLPSVEEYLTSFARENIELM